MEIAASSPPTFLPIYLLPEAHVLGGRFYHTGAVKAHFGNMDLSDNIKLKSCLYSGYRP